MAFFIFLLSYLIVICSSSAIDFPRRSVCDFDGATPNVGQDYYGPSCPPYLTLDSNGQDCKTPTLGNNYCAGFCQMKTTFYYGQEQPFTAIPACRPGQTCSMSASNHQVYKFIAQRDPKLDSAALKAGITGGFGITTGIAELGSFSVQMGANECGYFTFIPLMKQTCGTYTSGCSAPKSTTGNECIDQLAAVGTIKNNLPGTVVFVYVDCDNFMPSPNWKQSPAYYATGVRLPRANLAAYQELWSRSQHISDLQAVPGGMQCGVSDSSPLISDCIAAIGSLTLWPWPGDHVPTAGTEAVKYKPWQVSVSGTCMVQVRYDEDWSGMDCSVLIVEVLASAQHILDSCSDPASDRVAGWMLLRTAGNCASHVTLTTAS